MLLQFSVNNFRSIKDTVTLSMTASSSTEGKHRFLAGDNVVLNSAVIYGANASGKSNVLKAFGFMCHLVLNKDHINLVDDPLPHDPFCLNTETEFASSYFEIIFLLDNIKYRYGFEADSTTVYAEWLYNDELCLFERDLEENNHYVNTERFKEVFNLNVPDNQLLIWQCELHEGELGQKILRWFQHISLVDDTENEAYFHLALKQIENSATRFQLIKLIKAAGLGINDLAVIEQDVTQEFIDNAPFSEEIKHSILLEGNSLTSIELRTQHTKFNAENEPVGAVQFELTEHESHGTKKFFALCAPILDALEHGKILLIDQLDAMLHPMLCECLISIFNNKEINKYRAQLIFSSHNTNFLSASGLLERDQIWFTQKNQFGSTELYSLLEFKKNNTTDNLEESYLKGRYGAIPLFGEAF